MAASKGSAAGIPAQVRASRALNRSEHYQGFLPLEQLPRLTPLLAKAGAELRIEVWAERDGEGAGWLRGKIGGVLPLTCQRGLHPFDWPFEVPVALRLVFSEQEEERALKDSEPYLVRNDQLPLREMVEDEVLLALPMMPRCGDPECIKRLQ